MGSGALAFVIHGLGEHILRYERIAKMLTDLGFKVCGHDHIGHGKSEGVRIDVEEFSFYARDCFQHVDMMKEKHPNLPLFVVSHSMGGLINIMMANERPKEFINLLISPCLGFNPKDATPLKISGAKLLSWCWYHKQLPKISSSLISRDPAVCLITHGSKLCVYFLGSMVVSNTSVTPHSKLGQITGMRRFFVRESSMPLKNLVKPIYALETRPKIMMKTPGIHGGPKVGFVVKMHNCIQAVLQAASSVEWPYFLLHGDADQICDVGGSRTFHNSAKSKDKTLKRTMPDWCFKLMCRFYTPVSEMETAVP
ncbi:putative monoglyceride lipase isoform X1 [Apostichopus japonicus]|uniref:Putative monoglyceride lipase isoform X1 n=1 Tax=Stichopus japonicus TaxID=307972 RepID=A0A2G8JX22_STIJA|nr:putative monoglyceride lipase isoform X1 [Apostichopus japonicus]